MVRTARQYIWLGSKIPIVPRKDFVKEHISDQTYQDMWSILGPTIERNYNTHNFERLLTIAFIEGLRMATHVISDKPELIDATRDGPNQAQTQTPQTLLALLALLAPPVQPRKLSI